MCDLTAQVTSGLLQFPDVTVEALGEDRGSIVPVLRGKLAAGDHGLACLACGSQLEVVRALTGERLSAYKFSGGHRQPAVVLAVTEFSWLRRTGLLVALQDAGGSVLCLYDLGTSRVVKAVTLPGKVTAVEPVSNHGGASTGTQHFHPALRWLFGVAAVVTDVGQLLLVDLCLDDLPSNQNEVEASDLEVIRGLPAEVPELRESAMRNGRHLCFQLARPSGVAISALSYIHRTNQLAVGYADGYITLWNMKSLRREYFTQLEDGAVPVHAVIFQEPENDPRNCCYLWAVQSTPEKEGGVLSLHLLQLAFGNRKRLASGQTLYEGLEYCEERYTLDLTDGILPLGTRTSNTKLLGCQSIEKFPPPGDREEGMREVETPDTSVSVFTWQANRCGQKKPSIYLTLFDINCWYHARMPDSLRSGEYLHNCSYFALWSLDSVVSATSPHDILDILAHEKSLSRGILPPYPPPEQFFNPRTYNFDATCLLNSGVVHITCTGFQKETLTFLKKSGPSLNEALPEGYNRGLTMGLLSPRPTDFQPSSLCQKEQLEAILSEAIHTSSLGLLTGWIERWIMDEQPNSAPNLHFVLGWTWNKVILTKAEFDKLCTPLFDGSCCFIYPQTMRSLQQCQRLLCNLRAIIGCFVVMAHAITERGIMDLSNKYMASQLTCQHAQVVLWFSHSGLLPEGFNDTGQLSQLGYNYPVIEKYYTGRRQMCERLSRGKWNPNCLMIDDMVSQLGERVEKLWKQAEGDTGKYPPPSLHALLDLYLQDSITEEKKHAVTIYVLLDITSSFPHKTDAFIESFATAFGIPWDQVKLTQGFWLLDHNDHEHGLNLLFHPATVKPVLWQHSKILHALMMQGEHRQALRYIQTMKPTVASDSDIILHLNVLLSNRCMAEAWSFLRQQSHRLSIEELLTHTYEVCQETGLMEDLLKLPFTDTEQECLVRCLQSGARPGDHEFLLVHHLQRAHYVPALKLNQTLKTNDCDPHLRGRSAARNSLVDQYGKVLPRIQRKLAAEQAKPYHLVAPSVVQEVSRPKSFFVVPTRAAVRGVLTRSTFIHNALSKLGKVWAGSRPKNSILTYNRRTMEPSPTAYLLRDAEQPGAWVGTPVSKAAQTVSRKLDSVAHPVPRLSGCLGFIHQPPLRSPLHLTSGSLPKAKTSALSVTSSRLAELTPRTSLRPGLQSTHLAPSSVSRGASFFPPSRLKGARLSFMGGGRTARQIAGATDDRKAKELVTTPSRHRGVPAKVKWLKNKDKATSLDLKHPEMDHQEMEVRPQETPLQSLEILDSSKRNSSASSGSDETTSEYQDALSPEDFETMFMSPKPASSSMALITQKGSNEDMLELEVTPPDPEQQMGTLEDAGTKNLLSAEETLAELKHLSPVRGADTSSCAPRIYDGKLLTPKSQVPVSDEVPAETCTSTGRAAPANVPGDHRSSGLITSESLVPLEHGLKQETAQNAKEDHDIEDDVLKASGNFPEEKPPMTGDPLETQGIQVVEHDKLDVQDSEQQARILSCREYPSGTCRRQHHFETTVQLFCDLPDDKDSAECDIAEADGELPVAQSNFTLTLEGEGEGETGDPAASYVLAKAANTVAKEEQVYAVGNDHVAKLPSVITSHQESQKAETLPCVPEAMTVATAKYLLDGLKDTGSKGMTSDTMEESIHETRPLINPKLVKSRFKTIQETSTVTMNVSQVDGMISSRVHVRGRVQHLDVRSVRQEDAADVATPEMLWLPNPKQTRKAKEISGASKRTVTDVKGISWNQQIPQNPFTPRRKKRKRDINQDPLESINSMEEDGSVNPGRGLRKLRASQLLEPPAKETSFREDVTKTILQRMKTSGESQECVEMVNDVKVSKVTHSSRSTRKVRCADLEASQDTGCQQVVTSSEQPLPVQPSERMPKGHGSASDVIEDTQLDSSWLALHAESDMPAMPRKRDRPRNVHPSREVGSKHRRFKASKVLSIRRGSRSNISATRERPGVGKPGLEKSIFVPSSKQKMTQRTEKQSRNRRLRSTAETSEKTSVKKRQTQNQMMGRKNGSPNLF